MTIRAMIIARPRLESVNAQDEASRIFRTVRFIINVKATGKNIWATILPFAGLPVNPIICVSKLRHR